MEHTEERQPPEVMTSDTDNATKIPVEEAPPGKKYKFSRFRAYNTGTWNGPKRENKEVIYRQDNLHRYDSLASSLDLNEYQKGRGRSLLDEFDFREEGVKVDNIIFGICVIVANDDVGEGSRYYPNPNAPDDDIFKEVGDSLELDLSQQASAVEKVRSRVNL